MKSVVVRRLQAASNELPEPQSKQLLQSSPTHTYQIGQLVLIQCEDSMDQQQCRQYSGCWGIVHDVYESTAVVVMGGEMVKYLLCDLQSIENPNHVLKQVCDRVARLWQVPNLPYSVECLLETFYQRRLDFLQKDLDVLSAIGCCVR